MTSKKSILLVSHGSKAPRFEAAMKKVAQALEKSGRFDEVLCAYLEVTSPAIPQGIEELVQKGVSEIIVVPYFLLTGKHVIADIPNIVKQAKAKYAGSVQIKLAPYLGFDEKIVSVVQERILEAQ